MDTFEKFGMRHYTQEEIDNEEFKMVRRYAIGVPLSILFLGTAACTAIYGLVALTEPKATHASSSIKPVSCVLDSASIGTPNSIQP